MVLIFVINYVAKQFKWSPQRGWLTAFLYVVAAALAFGWSAFVLPPFPAFDGPVAFVAAAFTYFNTLLTELGPVVALATLIYNVLGKRVLDALEAKTATLFAPSVKKSTKK
jgi:hypothetical protein